VGEQVALITGGSRGIGAATALALAEAGWSVAITYRNKARRAAEVVEQIEACGQSGLALSGDLTDDHACAAIIAAFQAWRPQMHALILNASGGLERDLLAADADYPMRINRDAQLALVERALPLLAPSATIVFVTSHWAHLYGRTPQLPTYGPVAASKFAGEHLLRARQGELAARGVRLLVVTADVIEGTTTPKLLERAAPGLTAERRASQGPFPTAPELGTAIAQAIADAALPSGATIVVGGSLESLLDAEQEGR
jgi:NAD(P)-dependent dehydrogenase (short-subunit alcohol dehydrogenase family)